MKGLFDLFFRNNYNLYLFIFFFGVFFLECIFLYNKELKVEVSKRLVLSLGAISALVSSITIFSTDFIEHVYFARFRPKNIACILEAYETAWSNPDKKYIESVRSIHPHCSQSFEVSAIYQTLLLFAFFVVGWLLCSACLKVTGNIKIFLAFPVGISIAAMTGLCLHICGIPINRITLLLCFVLLIGIILFRIKKKAIVICKKDLVKQGVLALVISAFVSLANLYYLSPDGIIKTYVGFQLANFNPSRSEFLYEVEYGVVEPILNCIGLKFSVDFLYGIYILMPICCIGLLLTAVKALVTDKKIGFLFAGIGAILVATNHDILFCGTFVLSNGMMSCFFLALVIILIFQIRGEKATWMLAVISMAMITIRIESSCYICLVIALFCGIKKFREECSYVALVLGGEMILWQIYMFIFAPRDLMFWTSARGAIVVVAAIITMLIPYILRIRVSFIAFICRNYYKIAILAFLVAGLGIFVIVPKTYFDVAHVFLAHFATATDSNSLALWGFALLMLPVLVYDKKKESGLLIAFTIDYLLATFIIYACRTNDPIHLEMNDSCRRAITQIMPTAMFAIAYILGEMNFDTKE